MTNSGDVAEQITKAYLEVYLEGTKVILNISGKAAKNVASAIYVILKDSKKTKGKTRLTAMIKSGKELKIFPVIKEDLKRFTIEAKRYGVQYCVILDKDKNISDGMVDIMVKSEDASKIDRIVKRFNINTLSETEIKSQIEKTRKNSQNNIEKVVQEKTSETTKNDEKNNPSPSIARATESPQSENSLDNKKKLEEITTNNKKKPSVRKELKDIKDKLESKTKTKTNEKTRRKSNIKNTNKKLKNKGRAK